eukprot:CAMPEP_0181288446 /NCGR_PEP_ID=MMETSP1101-20121128/336_1 /TAXON_ID=46948 /ORGANISM="Rhodomonas abbreviata, Strain Caron Lab Isolate" /LENGTH=200 /DNA_ID=CAMNT_0023392567 /DNA_START=246 /DNA_END=844 /DNA_ORIENTATION=-
MEERERDSFEEEPHQAPWTHGVRAKASVLLLGDCEVLLVRAFAHDSAGDSGSERLPSRSELETVRIHWPERGANAAFPASIEHLCCAATCVRAQHRRLWFALERDHLVLSFHESHLVAIEYCYKSTTLFFAKEAHVLVLCCRCFPVHVLGRRSAIVAVAVEALERFTSQFQIHFPTSTRSDVQRFLRLRVFASHPHFEEG